MRIPDQLPDTLYDVEELRSLSVTNKRMCGIELAVTVIALKESWLRSPRDLDPEEGAIPEGSRPNNPAIAALHTNT